MSTTPETGPKRGNLTRKLEAVRATTDATAKALGHAAWHRQKAIVDASDYLIKTHIVKDASWEAVKENPIPLPHAQAAVELFARTYPESATTAKGLQELLREFYTEELKNSAMYKTEDGQATLPFTYINVTDVARKIYDAYRRPRSTQEEKPEPEDKDKPKPETEVKPAPKTDIFFTLGSFLNPKGDGQFTFPEYAMHEFMKKLPIVLKKLEARETPDNYILYTIGYPTSLFGKINNEAVEEIEKDPYGKSAEWFSQFVKSHLTQDTSHVHFWGESMGGHFETATAMRLVDENALTQDQDKRRTEKRPDAPPYLTIVVDAPEMHKKWTGWKKKLKTNLGFALDAGVELISRPDMRKWFSQNTFLASIAEELRGNGFEIHMSGDQPGKGKGFLTKTAYELTMAQIRGLTGKIGIGKIDPNSDVALKRRALKALTDTIRDGWDYDHDKIKVEQRAGKHDHTLDLGEFTKIYKKKEEENARRKPETYLIPHGEPGYVPFAQRAKQPNPLGNDMVMRTGKTRTYAVNMNHMTHKFNSNELKRYKHTSEVYLNLKAFGQTKKPDYLIAEAAGQTGHVR